MLLLSGQVVAQQRLESLTHWAKHLPSTAPQPGVAFVLVGEDGPSNTYVQRKQIVAQQVGFGSQVHRLPMSVSQAELLRLIHHLNEDPQVHGFLVQAPLPAHIDSYAIYNAIAPHKDIDGFHALNLGYVCQGDIHRGFIPCTPAGIVELLKHYRVPIDGQHVVVVGRSLTVGRPAALLFLEKTLNATVSICHRGTRHLSQITQQADILIAAMGCPGFIQADHVKPQSIVIDVGITRVVDATCRSGYRLMGDVAFEAVCTKVAAITPVPGGVGPLTVAQLMHNTAVAYKRQFGFS